jgi:hypothetical protein
LGLSTHEAHLLRFSVGRKKAMIFDLPIGLLITTRRREFGITTAEIARRVGYRNIGKGVRRINELCQGDFRAAQFIVAGLPRALKLPEDDVRRAIQATEDELDARERARLEAEERIYRRRFAPTEAAARAAPYCHAKLANVELTAAVQVEQPIDFSMLDAEERQQLRAMLERRRGPVPVGLEDDAGVRALPPGERRGGRQKGTLNKRTAEMLAEIEAG